MKSAIWRESSMKSAIWHEIEVFASGLFAKQDM
jgi:hypothetical protein